MHKLLARIARHALCTAIITGSALVSNASYAVPLKSQPQAPVFTRNCAMRLRCIANFCARSGRCSLGSHIQVTGCLLHLQERSTAARELPSRCS